MSDFNLVLSCPDRPGIVAAVTTELANIDANIIESNQFRDPQNLRLFMRVAFETPQTMNCGHIERLICPVTARFDMQYAIFDTQRKPRIIVMVSKFDHALLHLLYQIRVG